MRIEAKDLGKQYQRQVVIQPTNITVEEPGIYVVLGGNGSGKSTLMKMLSGMLTPSKGSLHYFDDAQQPISADKRYEYIAFAGPYHEVIEEMTLKEFLTFTSIFRPFVDTPEACLEMMNLKTHAHKQIAAFSSGMKQRVKLGLALFSTARVVFLDEPVSHLDAKAIAWYQSALVEAAKEKMVFVASNHNAAEYPNARQEFVVD